MKTFRIITAIVLVVGLIGVFHAFSAEQTKQGKKEGIITDTQESKDKQKAPAPGSTTMQAPGASLQSLPLTITRLYLKDGTVHVVIKKQGSKPISDKEYEATKLKVEASTVTKPLEWTLQQVDPQKRLNHLKREKDFDTGLAVTERIQVTATLYRGLWKTAKDETLLPKMAKVDVKTRMGAPAQKRDVVLPSEPVLLYDDRGGIRITSPTTDDVIDFSRDSTEPIAVIYRVTNPDIPAGNITFTLLKIFDGGRRTTVAETTISYIPPDVLFEGLPLTLHWNVYEDIRAVPCDGQYSIRAEHENGAWGTSDIFTIDCPGEGGFEGWVDVDVVYPNGGEHIWEGHGTIRWRIVGQYDRAPGPWSIDLYRGDERELHIESDCEDHEDGRSGSVPYRECSVTFLEEGTPAGIYTVRVSNGELSDESDAPFGIGISEEWTIIYVTAPASTHGADIARGEDIPYRWDSSEPMRCRVHLVKGDRIVDTIDPGGRSTAVGEGNFEGTYETGDDYKVRAENEANPDNFGESRTFAIRDCVPDFAITHLDINHSNHIIATTVTGCPGSIPVTYRIEKGNYCEMGRSVPSGIGDVVETWDVTVDVNDLSGGGMGVEVDLGEIRGSADCDVCFRVTVDWPNDYHEYYESGDGVHNERISIYCRPDYRD